MTAIRTATTTLTMHTAMIDARNAAFLRAESERSYGTHEADVEYSETVSKLRERFEADLFDAAAHRLGAVLPVHRAYNAAVIAAEHTVPAPRRADHPGR